MSGLAQKASAPEFVWCGFCGRESGASLEIVFVWGLDAAICEDCAADVTMALQERRKSKRPYRKMVEGDL